MQKKKPNKELPRKTLTAKKTPTGAAQIPHESVTQLIPRKMPPSSPSTPIEATTNDQMLRLVAKGFYKELVNYGVKEPEIITVASNLLDNVALKSPPEGRQQEKYSALFTLKDVEDHWNEDNTISLEEISIRPFSQPQLPNIVKWLKNPAVSNSFYPRFPTDEDELLAHLTSSDSEYFVIQHGDEPVGIIGGEHLETETKKIEMKKLIGNSDMRGMGIGKRATFLYLYYIFIKRNFHKVYLHTLNINIRNLNLNGNFGFWLEGVFFDDIKIDDELHDLVRMALTKPAWLELFSN